MDDGLMKIHTKLERRVIREAALNFREAMAFRRTGWRTRLLKLDMALSQFVAWYAAKLLGWREGDLEPQAIAEWNDETGDFEPTRETDTGCGEIIKNAKTDQGEEKQ